MAWSWIGCTSDSEPGAGSAGAAGDTMATGSGGANAGSGGASNVGGANVGTAGSGGATAGAGQGGMGGGAIDGGSSVANAVYTMSNAAAGNMMLGFLRATDGTLTPMAAPFPTGGKGTGMGLGEQGAIAYDLAGNRIYAVNAGDNSFSVFPVNSDGSLGTVLNVGTATLDGGGATLLGPKSITFHGDTIYVLFEGNETTPSLIGGWTLKDAGGLTATPIAGSILPLSSATKSVDPAQIEFSPDGKWILVTEKQSGAGGAVMGAGSIDSFSVDSDGLAKKMGFYPTASAGADAGLQMTPFGFEFYRDYVVVSEAGSTGVGSYMYAGGVIAPVSATSQFLPTDPAPCWVTFSENRAYVANARGPNISGFTVGSTGGLTRIGSAANAVVAMTGKTIVPDAGDAGTTIQGPTDEFVSQDGKYLYVLNAAVPSIGIFSVKDDGTLARVGAADYTPVAAALTVGSAGIVAR